MLCIVDCQYANIYRVALVNCCQLLYFMLISCITSSWTIPVYYSAWSYTILFATNTSVFHTTRNTTVTAHVVYIIKCTQLMLQLGTLLKCSCFTITIEEWGTQLQGHT